MKNYLAVLLLSVGLTSAARATVTIQFSEPFAGGIPSNLANGAGTVTDGMRWGIVVDTTGNGFSNSGTSYDAYTAGVTTNGFLSASGSVSDDYYIAGTLTVDGLTSGLQEGDFSTVPGHGSILDDLTNIALTNGVSAGDSFALVWFSSNTSAAGDKYGFLSNGSFVMPADSNTTSFGSPFVGNDSIRTASSTFASAVAPIPEPSRVLLLGVGALGLISRRRRKVA